jgi:hypothetical protein
MILRRTRRELSRRRWRQRKVLNARRRPRRTVEDYALLNPSGHDMKKAGMKQHAVHNGFVS